MSKEEVAKELTLAIIGKILAVDTSTNEARNASLASEVAKAYTIILQNMPDVNHRKASSGKPGMV